MSEQNPELSVIVIAYNGREYLSDCLHTLLEDLEGINGEVIVIDNASTDGSRELIREHFASVRLIELERNLGFTKAVNWGIAAADSPVLLILNQDTRIRKGALSALLRRLRRDDKIGVIGPKFVGFDGNTQLSARAFPTFRHVWYDALFLSKMLPQDREFASWRMGWFDHESELEVDQPMGAAIMVRREVINEVGLLDESFPMFFSDVDWCHRMVRAGYRNLYFPEAVIVHAVGGSTSRHPIRWRFESHVSMYRYLAKYSRWYSRPLLWLTGLALGLGLAPSLIGRLFHRRV